MKPVKRRMEMSPIMISGRVNRLASNSFPASLLKTGSKRIPRPTARIIAIRDWKTDSPKNCRTSWPLKAPTTLRNPTSLERCKERAVDRFMKLMQAISKTKRAAAKNMTIYLVFPVPNESYPIPDDRCILKRGWRESFSQSSNVGLASRKL